MRFLESYSNYLNDVAVFQLRLQCFKHSICVVCYSQCKKLQNLVLNLTNGFLCLFDGVTQLILEIFSIKKAIFKSNKIT